MNSTSQDELDAQQLFQTVIGLAQCNDADLVDDPRCFPCAPESHSFWRGVRDLIVELRAGYDYTQSPEFIAALVGKSDQFVSVATRMALQKRADHMRNLDDALGSGLCSDRVFDLIPGPFHHRLREALASIRALIDSH